MNNIQKKTYIDKDNSQKTEHTNNTTQKVALVNSITDTLKNLG